MNVRQTATGSAFHEPACLLALHRSVGITQVREVLFMVVVVTNKSIHDPTNAIRVAIVIIVWSCHSFSGGRERIPRCHPRRSAPSISMT